MQFTNIFCLKQQIHFCPRTLKVKNTVLKVNINFKNQVRYKSLLLKLNCYSLLDFGN